MGADLKTGPGNLSEVPTVIAFCEGCHANAQASAIEAMTPLAQKYLERQREGSDEDLACAFRIATDIQGLPARLREVMSMPKEAGLEPALVLLDTPQNGAFYTGPVGEITQDAV